jgi:methylated-DNA-[protein]-cysteine S-methyltransferase
VSTPPRPAPAKSGARAYQAVLSAPFGHVGIRTRDRCLVGVDYLDASIAPLAPRDALAREACAQIEAYLADAKHRFDLPYVLEGSEFQRAVWCAIGAIGCGTTRTYGELALELGNAARAVGGACGSNPVPLIVPCHRVVAAGGKIGGFMHSRATGPLSIKRWLLQHEGIL